MDVAHNVALPPAMRSYIMNRSVVVYFVGNDSAANSPAEDKAEERFGIVGVGWQLGAVASNFTRLEQHELATAKRLKARAPGIRIMVARNTDCGALNQNQVAAALKYHPEWFLRDGRGKVFEVPWVANDPTFFGHQNFWMPSPYFNYSNQAAADWWVQEYVGAAVRQDTIDGVYWDACGPQAPPTKMRSFPCPGRKQPPVEPDCHYPRSGLAMSGAAVSQYYVDAYAAFDRAQALIAAAGKWSSTWAAESFSNQTCCRGCKPECRSATVPECVASVVKLIDAATQPNHTLQLRVPLPDWTATSGPPSHSNGEYIDFWVKLFLLVRGEQSLLYFPGQGGAFSYAKDYPPFPASMHADYGQPLSDAPTLGAGPGGPLSVFTRQWTRANVTLDCSSFALAVTPK
jgi:hypothetical protein